MRQEVLIFLAVLPLLLLIFWMIRVKVTKPVGVRIHAAPKEAAELVRNRLSAVSTRRSAQATATAKAKQ